MWWSPVQRILKWALLVTPGGADLLTKPAPRQCTGNHENHICALAGRSDFTDIKSLTEKPAFVCANCGRVATAAQNLCNPLSLDKISIGMPHLA